jgi:hypothetical protein
VLENKIITSLCAGIPSCACESQSSQQNGTNCLLKCRAFLSQQGSTLLKMKRMTFMSCQQAGTMTQPKSWRRYRLIAGSVGQLQENEAVLKVESIPKSPFKNVLENKPAKSKNRRTNSQPASQRRKRM